MKHVTAIVVKQWLEEWETVRFDPEELRSRPPPEFYLCSISAAVLRRLAGIQRRRRTDSSTKDLGIQRRHDTERSEEIARYIRGGYPWSTLGVKSADRERFADVRMPGWLPTAIVVNILTANDSRYEASVDSRDLIEVRHLDSGLATIVLPTGCEAPQYRPRALPPLEVIDGQHRLWAFDESGELDGRFEIPVVALHGLDVGWQAYLFWTINVKPKRISPSLAFDLYPLLRTQSWLESAAAEGPLVYRETRAQELTETLWSHPSSPWYQRINMLGEPGGGDVSQAAFIRSLLASYVKRASGRGITIGGLYGSELEGGQVLPWTRAQQAAFLIFVWHCVQHSVERSQERWARDLVGKTGDREAVFSGPYSLLATDQGVRAVLQVTNDLSFVLTKDLDLASWRGEQAGEAPSEEAVTSALDSLERSLPAAARYIKAMAEILASFDWRSSAAPGLDADGRLGQAAFRGSGGYKELRIQLLRLLAASRDSQVSSAAKVVAGRLGYELN